LNIVPPTKRIELISFAQSSCSLTLEPSWRA
jgi:hypothetical protein